MPFGEYTLVYVSASLIAFCQRGRQHTLVHDRATQSLSGASYVAVVATAHKLVYYIARSEHE